MRQRHFRAGRADCMAHTPAWPDTHHCGWLRLGAALGRTHRANPARRCGVVLARRKALARRHTDHGHDAYRNSGKARRQGRRLVRISNRRSISTAERWVRSAGANGPAIRVRTELRCRISHSFLTFSPSRMYGLGVKTPDQSAFSVGTEVPTSKRFASDSCISILQGVTMYPSYSNADASLTVTKSGPTITRL